MLTVVQEATRFATSLAHVNKRTIRVVPSMTPTQLIKLHRQTVGRYVKRSTPGRFGLHPPRSLFSSRRSYLPSYPRK